MPEEIRVISSDLDGAELRRDIHKNSFYARCDGKMDNEQLQDAVNCAGKLSFSITSEGWDRIFGGK